MKHIPFPPTRTDEVKETIVQSKMVPEEHGSTFAGITYDLAIVKIGRLKMKSLISVKPFSL